MWRINLCIELYFISYGCTKSEKAPRACSIYALAHQQILLVINRSYRTSKKKKRLNLILIMSQDV